MVKPGFSKNAGSRGQENPHPDTESYVREIMDLKELGTSDTADPMSSRNPVYATFALVGLFIVSTFLNVSGSFSIKDTYSIEDEETAIRLEIYDISQNLDVYRAEHGMLPDELESIGLAEEGIEYVNLGSSYILVGATTGEIIKYTDGDDLAPFEAAVDKLLMGEKS